MLRITTLDLATQIATLRVEGRLVGPWVHELRIACESVLRQGRALNLDLVQLEFADVWGLELLSSIKKRGVTLANPSPFLEEELNSFR